MRSEALWEEKVLPKKLSGWFPPRIVKDLTQYGSPQITTPIQSMFLWGAAGVGKTLFAAWVLIEKAKEIYLSGESKECMFVSVPELINELQTSFSDSEKKASEILDRCRKSYLLVLDDFGAVKPTEWVYQVMYLVINYRYENLLPTVITSNLSLSELEVMFGDSRVVSRIDRMCTVYKKSTWRK
jgi:DNA replication protein DnaC